jgi:hypothetical protein
MVHTSMKEREAPGPYFEVEIQEPSLEDVAQDYLHYRRSGGEPLKQLESLLMAEGFDVEQLLTES